MSVAWMGSSERQHEDGARGAKARVRGRKERGSAALCLAYAQPFAVGPAYKGSHSKHTRDNIIVQAPLD